ncbi:MAG: alkaline phosphatase [Planctomycetes bacterium]|nr:alkaline phosphatase [Planctomycetota bacterium]
MIKLKKISFVLLLSLLIFLAGCSQQVCNKTARAEKVKNVIFCIGDGMGTAHITLARIKSRGIDGKLNMEQMPVTGWIRTHSADSAVTDSAAAGTALAVGVKTDNKMIGMTADGTKYQTILEAVKEKGFATGLVVTSAITHATPASFGSHVTRREMENEIAEQLIENEITVLFGGGREFFLPKANRKSKRNDQRDLIVQARALGYLYIETAAQLKKVRDGKVLGLFQDGALTTEKPEPSLAELTEKALEILSKDEDGFFLMVEGSQIDWKAHENNADGVVKQLIDFDEAVKVAVDFASRDGQTLVIVTADHETGGLTITGGDLEGKLDLNFSTGGHTGVPLPVYAFGPGAEEFGGVHDNTEIPKKFADFLGIKPFPKKLK